uniref:ferredoxin n=1 Tax=Flavobacterium sp. TaxID=239 RepID=UPI00404AFD72
MVVVTLQREKCIGCNYCVEMAPAQFQMSKKDGKTVLINSTDSKGFHTIKTNNYSVLESCELAEKACPVKIISVKIT